MKRLLVLMVLAGCGGAGKAVSHFGVAPEQVACPPAGILVPTQSEQSFRRLRQKLLDTNLISREDSVIPLRNDGIVRLANKREVVRVMEQNYPRWMADQSRGGKGSVLFRVDSLGQVHQVRIAESSGYVDMDRAIVRSASAMRFEPLQIGGCSAGYWALIPISFIPPPNESVP